MHLENIVVRHFTNDDEAAIATREQVHFGKRRATTRPRIYSTPETRIMIMTAEEQRPDSKNKQHHPSRRLAPLLALPAGAALPQRLDARLGLLALLKHLPRALLLPRAPIQL